MSPGVRNCFYTVEPHSHSWTFLATCGKWMDQAIWAKCTKMWQKSCQHSTADVSAAKRTISFVKLRATVKSTLKKFAERRSRAFIYSRTDSPTQASHGPLCEHRLQENFMKDCFCWVIRNQTCTEFSQSLLCLKIAIQTSKCSAVAHLGQHHQSSQRR